MPVRINWENLAIGEPKLGAGISLCLRVAKFDIKIIKFELNLIHWLQAAMHKVQVATLNIYPYWNKFILTGTNLSLLAQIYPYWHIFILTGTNLSLLEHFF